MCPLDWQPQLPNNNVQDDDQVLEIVLCWLNCEHHTTICNYHLTWLMHCEGVLSALGITLFVTKCASKFDMHTKSQTTFKISEANMAYLWSFHVVSTGVNTNKTN